MTPTSHRLLTGMVWLMTAGIAAQAVLAGQFISGLADLQWLHLIVGSVLELLALVLFVVVLAAGWTSRQHRGLWLSTLLLSLAVLTQAGLGHAPGALPTAIHVPLGAALLAWSLGLSAALPRRPAAREHRAPERHQVATG